LWEKKEPCRNRDRKSRQGLKGKEKTFFVEKGGGFDWEVEKAEKERKGPPHGGGSLLTKKKMAHVLIWFREFGTSTGVKTSSKGDF